MKAVPAIKGKMGSTNYYMTRLTGRELAHIVRPVRDSDVFASESIDEQIQRDIDNKRVLTELVPYMANHEDRFWGSIIVLAEKDKLDFEPVTDVIGKQPRAYQESLEVMGFLTQLGGELIALDGQHRLVATREVITSQDTLGEQQKHVNDDEMSVIVIEYENHEKTRRIFNKVNRHAKPTGRSDNILLSEDDGYAIVTRLLLDRSRNAPLANVLEQDGTDRPLVNWKSTTLTKTMRHLTTLSAVYDTVRHILIDNGFPEEIWDEKKNAIRPDGSDIDAAYDIASEWWNEITTRIDVLREVREGKLGLDEIREIRFDDTDRRTLLLRPVGQIALVRGVLEAIRNAKSHGKTLTLQDALDKANKINWSASPANYFRDTIVRANGRMTARNESYRLAGALIAYLIGDDYLDDEQRRALWRSWNQARGKLVEDPKGNWLDDDEIKDALAELDPEEARDRKPEDLPAPVV